MLKHCGHLLNSDNCSELVLMAVTPATKMQFIKTFLRFYNILFTSKRHSQWRKSSKWQEPLDCALTLSSNHLTQNRIVSIFAPHVKNECLEGW